MRALRLAVAFAAALITASIASPAEAASGVSVGCAVANAGTDVACTVARGTGDNGRYILFATSDGTAKAGTDYVAVKQMIYFKSGVLSQIMYVHTLAAPGASGTLSFNAAVSDGLSAGRTTGTIVEAAAPAPPAASTVDVLDEGDSISYFWAGSHSGIYARTHPSVIYKGNAVGGAGLGEPGDAPSANTLYARQAADLALHPKVLTVLIGANDVPGVGAAWNTGYPTPQSWADALFAYVAPFRAAGAKVAVGTILPQCITGNPESGSDLALNTNRAAINPLIRAALGSKIDAVIDYAADPVMGPDQAACDSTLYDAGLHPTDGTAGPTDRNGQGKLEAIYAPVVDALLAAAAPPAPPAQPTETAADNPMTGQSPGVGAPDIPTTDHDVMTDLQAAWDTGAIPASNAPDVLGAFRFVCRHTNLAFDDPTVFHDQPGVSHLHDQTGVYGWNAFSNYGNLRRSGGGSGCNDVAGHDQNAAEVSQAGNRTPYWQPALLDGKGNVIVADFTSFYYKRRPLTDPVVSDPTNAQYKGKAVRLPNGIKFIFGADWDDPSKSIGAFFKCVNPTTGAGITTDGTFAGAIACAKTNSSVADLEVQMTAPDCWDGINLDSADHRSHLSYASYGDWGYEKCDAAHPYVIPAFTYAAFYTVLPSDDGDIHFSSDEMDNSKPRGWSFHVDYGPAAWDPQVLAMWEDNCLDKLLSCSGGDLGNGKMLKGAAIPLYRQPGGYWQGLWRNPQHLVPIPAKSSM